MNYSNIPSSLNTLAIKRDTKRKRVSSYDKKGGNDDRVYIRPGETFTICDIKGAGCINHIWYTLANDGFIQEKYNLRKPVLKFYWDMPFAERAHLTVVNECETTLILYFYIDYEEYEELPEEMLRFHALWNRELPTKGVTEKNFETHRDWCFEGANLTGEKNYVLFEAAGRGHYVGCNINIHNLNSNGLWDWPGEGDDMIFIDGEPWPPRLHGTGTEDYVNMAWCPRQEYSAPYHGLILGGEDNWKGKISYYRYHIQDPIMFDRSIKVTIEHGHDNHRSDDWSTTAYWYQTEPHVAFAEILPVDKRLPIEENEFNWEGKI